MPLTAPQLYDILSTLKDYESSPADFFLSLLRNNDPAFEEATASIASDVEEILDAAQANMMCSELVENWAITMATDRYLEELLSLTRKQSGLQYKAKDMTEDILHSITVSSIADTIEIEAPHLSALIGCLLSTDPRSNRRRKRASLQRSGSMMSQKGKARARDEDIDMSDFGVDEDMLSPLLGADEDEPEDFEDQIMERHMALLKVKRVVCISIMINSSNQRCNALQSTVGMFLQSCDVPETVRELLAHMGISVSTTSTNTIVNKLATEVETRMKALGKSFLVSYAYDNLDLDLKHSTPTVERSEDTLIHLTTGTMLPLHPDVSLEDLDCSNELWNKSPYNTSIPPNQIPSIDLEDILMIHLEEPDPMGLLSRDRFNKWKFLHDLVNFGPEYFRQFRSELGLPEVFDEIPIFQTKQVPNRALDIHPSTPAENAAAMEAFFRQAGIGDLKQNPLSADILNRVIIVLGDLLTAERARSLAESRSQERTPWRRLQFIVFVMGLFHLKMACADAIWRIFIYPPKARVGANSLLEHVGQIRPKETMRIASKPGFRRMHEVIQHIGIVSRLDCWRLDAKKRIGTETLEDFAKTEPTWELLENMAETLAVDYASMRSFDHAKTQPAASRDQELENMMLRQQYFLLYEETSYAMNAGDIGRLERCFVPWMFIFKGCGKHKYASELRRYMENMFFIYPEGLRNAIRKNILCNPTGKKHHFRGVDWLVEHNNLYTKRIYGGKYSNHQKSRIITESPLIEVYKSTRQQFEDMFCLEHKTSRHSPPKMGNTFAKLGLYMQRNTTNEYTPGRSTTYAITDVMAEGMHLLMTDDKPAVESEWEQIPDTMEAVEDEGDLNMD